MRTQKNNIIITIILLVVVGAGAFYGGMTYATKAADAARQARFGQFGGPGGGRGGARNGAGFAAGDISAKDATTLTITMRDGGSKIVLISPATPVMKSVGGTSDDLAIGKSVVIMGTPNPDGSITAQSVQLRPADQKAQ